MAPSTVDTFIEIQEAIHEQETLLLQRKQLLEEINLLKKLKVVVGRE